VSIKPKRAKAALPVNVSTKRAGMYKYEVITESGLGHTLLAASREDAVRRFRCEFFGEKIAVVRRVRDGL
jgi:hypothetical protein